RCCRRPGWLDRPPPAGLERSFRGGAAHTPGDKLATLCRRARPAALPGRPSRRRSWRGLVTVNPSESGFRVDPFRGGRDPSLSFQWMMRAAGGRVLSLSDVFATAKDRWDRSEQIRASNRDIELLAPEITREDPNSIHRLALQVKGDGGVVGPMTHYTFNQLCQLAGAPS